MIELKELTLGYGQRTLLEMVNARMTSGQLIALLGRNGAGKEYIAPCHDGTGKATVGRNHPTRQKNSLVETGKTSP